jgi:hypothetical protein
LSAGNPPNLLTNAEPTSFLFTSWGGNSFGFRPIRSIRSIRGSIGSVASIPIARSISHRWRYRLTISRQELLHRSLWHLDALQEDVFANFGRVFQGDHHSTWGFHSIKKTYR